VDEFIGWSGHRKVEVDVNDHDPGPGNDDDSYDLGSAGGVQDVATVGTQLKEVADQDRSVTLDGSDARGAADDSDHQSATFKFDPRTTAPLRAVKAVDGAADNGGLIESIGC
jgi:hypothetical protein